MPNGPNIIHELCPNTADQFSINSGTEDYYRLAQRSGNILTTLLPPKEILSLEHAHQNEVLENGETNLGVPQKRIGTFLFDVSMTYDIRIIYLQAQAPTRECKSKSCTNCSYCCNNVHNIATIEPFDGGHEIPSSSSTLSN